MPPPNAARCNAMPVGRTGAPAGSRIRAARSAGSLVMTRPGPDSGQRVPLSLASRRRPLLPRGVRATPAEGEIIAVRMGLQRRMSNSSSRASCDSYPESGHLLRDLPAPVRVSRSGLVVGGIRRTRCRLPCPKYESGCRLTRCRKTTL